MVEDDDGSGEHCLGVLRAERELTELEQAFGGLIVADEVEARGGLVNVTKHLERHQVIVVDDFVVWVLNIHALQILDDGRVERIPVVLQDVVGLVVVLEEQPQEVDHGDLGFLFGRFHNRDEVVDRFVGNSLQVKGDHPLFEGLYLSHLLLDLL